MFLTTLFLDKQPGGQFPVFSSHSLPETDNLLFLIQRKREITFPQKNMPDWVDLEASCIQS